MVSVAGLKMSREGLWVVALTAANVFMFMLICWYKRRSDQKIEIILEEQRAGFYRQITTHSKLVMDIYREVDGLNEEVKQRSGKDLAPMVKYIVDDTVKELPKKRAIAPVRSAPPPKRAAPSARPAPASAPPRAAPPKIVPAKVIEKIPVDKHMNIV
jgi:hypothetical protein